MPTTLVTGATGFVGSHVARALVARGDDVRVTVRATSRLEPLNVLFGTRYTALCYGYNAFWRHCLEHMQVTCDGFEVETLINVRIAQAGLKVAKVPSMELERLHGESKLNAWRDGRRVLKTILKERFRTPQPVRDPDSWRPHFDELDPHTVPLAA